MKYIYYLEVEVHTKSGNVLSNVITANTLNELKKKRLSIKKTGFDKKSRWSPNVIKLVDTGKITRYVRYN